ncbi:MAG: DnaJ domain-containing protein [Limisphaerales bacterium]
MNEFQTYYEILELTESATQAEIRAARLRLAREYHPDGIPLERVQLRKELAIRMQEINEAYGILYEPEKREQYDTQLKDVREQARRTSAANHSKHASSPVPSQPSPY